MNQYFLSCFFIETHFFWYSYSIQSNIFMTEPFDLGDCCSWPQVQNHVGAVQIFYTWCQKRIEGNKTRDRNCRPQRSKPRIHLTTTLLFRKHFSLLNYYCTGWPIANCHFFNAQKLSKSQFLCNNYSSGIFWVLSKKLHRNWFLADF